MPDSPLSANSQWAALCAPMQLAVSSPGPALRVSIVVHSSWFTTADLSSSLFRWIFDGSEDVERAEEVDDPDFFGLVDVSDAVSFAEPIFTWNGEPWMWVLLNLMLIWYWPIIE